MEKFQTDTEIAALKSAKNKVIAEDRHNQIDISFKNLNYIVKVNDPQLKQGRIILNNISGYCGSGQITAIMGSSGAGKTSLLNILAKRIESDSNVNISGDILVNGKSYDSQTFPTFASYVMQNDILFETFTPLEAITFVANLKFKDPDFKQKSVKDTISSLKLERCQHTIIGGLMVKGLSGGERKRTSIALELVTDPYAILLDEPTSGLDSFTSFVILNMLKKICKEKGKTVIFTIHQPSSDIFQLFDRIMLLVEGQFIYQGPKDNIVKYFGEMGFQCPQFSNPMDYIMSIMHAENQINVENFPKYFSTYQTKLKPLVDQDIQNQCQLAVIPQEIQTTYFYQIQQICSRAWINLQRDKLLLRGRLGQAIFMGLIVGIIYYGIGTNLASSKNIQSMNGILFFSTINHLMMALNPVMITFPSERAVFLREENSKLYTTGAYFIGKSSVEMPLLILVPIIQELICYWMISYNDSNVSIVLIHLVIYFLLSVAGNSIGLLGGCFFKDVKVAAGVIPLFIMPLMLFSGFFQNFDNMMPWISWLQWLSPMKYAFEASARNQYSNLNLIVKHLFFNHNIQFPQPDPTIQLNFSLGEWQCVVILIGYIIGTRLLAYVFLYALKGKIQ